jgi:Flp pilus assembly protein TadG
MKISEPRKQSGQALMELAIALPILLVLVVGLIDVGRYAYIAILIGNAARAGAAYGSQSNGQSVDTTGIANAADYDFAGATSGTTTTNNGQLVSALTVTSSVSCGCDSGGTMTSYGTGASCNTTTTPNAGNCPALGTASGNWVVMVSVTASGSFNALFGFPGIPSPFTISRTATMRVQ